MVGILVLLIPTLLGKQSFGDRSLLDRMPLPFLMLPKVEEREQLVAKV